MSRRTLALLFLGSFAVLGAAPRPAAVPTAADRAAAAVRPAGLRAHVLYLADDLLEGRGTGSRGYLIAAKYVAAQFEALGLAPGGEKGTYFQSVPFLALDVDPRASFLALEQGGHTDTLAAAVDYLMRGDWLRERWTMDAPLAFVGYGVSAPELGYDDYAGIDVKGKVVVMMRGAPKSFEHNQRALYSWGYTKEQAAAAHGAAGMLGLRTPQDEKRFSWERAVRQSRLSAMRWTDAEGRPHDVQPQLEIDAGLSRSGAEKVFAGAPTSLAEVFAMADSGRSRSFDLVPRLHARSATSRRRLTSPNVVGVLPGSDPLLGNEAVVVSAHLDHLGIGTPVDGDSINNGAYDNASGVAMMLELARVMTASGKAPRRTVVFLAVTGEEKGLQGSDYFAQFPTVPQQIVADVNVDMFLMNHPFVESVVYGAEHSSLGAVVDRAAAKLGVKVVPDPAPEEVVFVRSDQFPFVRQGVPSIFPDAGGGSIEWRQADVDWERNIYHSPQDGPDQKFDWDAGARFTRFVTLMTFDIANGAKKPAWNTGDYFGARFGAKK